MRMEAFTRVSFTWVKNKDKACLSSLMDKLIKVNGTSIDVMVRVFPLRFRLGRPEA